MRNASEALLGSIIFLAVATNCGGDDSSNATSAGGSAGASGSSATTTGSGGAGGTSTGGTSTGSGGSGGSSSDAGAGCPPAQPAASTACDLDHDCTYGSATCSCVDMLWTCSGPPPEGGAGCPMADPADGESCSVQGLVCDYFGLVCTCNTQTGWTCVQSARAR